MRVAAIDCGTNSLRLLIADISQENQGQHQFREVYRAMEVVRLGEGVDQNKAFLPAAIERTLSVVQTYAEEITRRGVAKIRFCATSATRDAANRDLFINGVQEILGVTPEVIPGSEEAALSFLGATKELSREDGPFLVIDIGGGSTEFVFGTDRVEAARSVDIGCVRMTERHKLVSPLSERAIAQATSDIDAAIALAAREVPITKARTVIAVAGTATTVAAAALGLESYDRYSIHLSRIAAEKAHDVSKNFCTLTRDQIAALGYMHPGRVDVISAGSLVLSRVISATGASEFVASESDILDGMAWSLVEK